MTLPDDIKIQYEKDVEMYLAEIEKLKRKSISAKEKLLNEQFDPFPNNGSQDDKIDFVLQFMPFISDLTLFPDEEVIQKLKDYQFASHTLKWMVRIEEITYEINRLTEIEGLFFMPYAFLFAVQAHLSTKLLINLMEDFELSKRYNNEDTNILFVDFDKRIRKREYNKELNQTPKMNSFDKQMNKIFDRLETVTSEDKGFSNKILRQSTKGNTSFFYSLIDMFYCKGISKNKVYLELFPLLKLIMKEKNVELLSFDQFKNKKGDKYDADYTKYQIARVKKILQKK
jgi:hypothetical protein